ncbi:MAG: hypothetical protein LBB41_06610 [Prevotellaceae bacterium]|nr:hypothetical protein [Prevotellaceae bacterium]
MARNTTKYGRNRKVDVEDRIKQAIVTVGTGAALNIVEGLVGNKVANNVLDYIELGVGIAAPMLVNGPGIERAGDALAAVAAYKVGQDLGLANLINGNASTTGFQDSTAIGQTFYPVVKNGFQKKFEQRKTKSDNILS